MNLRYQQSILPAGSRQGKDVVNENRTMNMENSARIRACLCCKAGFYAALARLIGLRMRAMADHKDVS